MVTSGQTVSKVASLTTSFAQCCSGHVCATGDRVGGDVGYGVGGGEVVGAAVGALEGFFVGYAVGWGVNPRKKGAY